MPSAVNTASNEPLNLASRSRMRNLNPPIRSCRSTTRLRACWGHPRAGRVRGDAQQVYPPIGDLHHEQDIDAFESDRIDVEEVAGQDRLGLAGEKLPRADGASATAWPGDQERRPPRSRQQPRQRRQHRPIRRLQIRTRDLAPQHRDLMAQNKNLDLVGAIAPHGEDEQLKNKPHYRVPKTTRSRPAASPTPRPPRVGQTRTSTALTSLRAVHVGAGRARGVLRRTGVRPWRGTNRHRVLRTG